MKVENGVFENIHFFEKTGNLSKKASRGWLEEEGKKYALNVPPLQPHLIYGTTSAEGKTLSLHFPEIYSISTGDYAVTPVGTDYRDLHVVYSLVHSATATSEYEPAPGSQVHLTLPPGTTSTFLVNFDDLLLLKKSGSGPDSLHVKSAFEVYE